MSTPSDLFWHCLRCGDHHPVEPTGDDSAYSLGDCEPCECGGTSHVVTLRLGACYEQGRALGMGEEEAWERARTWLERMQAKGATP